MNCYFIGMMYGKFLLYKISLLHADHTTIMYIYGHHRQLLFVIGQLKKCSLKLWTNKLEFGRMHLWKVLYKVSSKQNDRYATQPQPTEPRVSLVLNIQVHDGGTFILGQNKN